jgi:hypothetical protein
MKRAGRITYALMSFAMLFATTACAANKGSLHVQSTTMAGKRNCPLASTRAMRKPLAPM